MRDWIALSVIAFGLTAVIIAAGWFMYWFFCRPAELRAEIRLDALSPFLSRLASGDIPFLIIEERQSGDFLQFSSLADGVQLDLPLISQRQLQLEPRLLATLKSRGLLPYETIGSDGTRFLDANLVGKPDQLTDQVSEIFQQVFNCDPGTIVVVRY
jgi:hypothetical protein